MLSPPLGGTDLLVLGFPRMHPGEVDVLSLRSQARSRCLGVGDKVYGPTGTASQREESVLLFERSRVSARTKAIARVEAEETQQERLPVMSARLLVVMVRPEGYNYIISASGSITTLGFMMAAHSSAASKGPTVLRRGRG